MGFWKTQRYDDLHATSSKILWFKGLNTTVCNPSCLTRYSYISKDAKLLSLLLGCAWISASQLHAALEPLLAIPVKRQFACCSSSMIIWGPLLYVFRAPSWIAPFDKTAHRGAFPDLPPLRAERGRPGKSLIGAKEFGHRLLSLEMGGFGGHVLGVLFVKVLGVSE